MQNNYNWPWHNDFGFSLSRDGANLFKDQEIQSSGMSIALVIALLFFILWILLLIFIGSRLLEKIYRSHIMPLHSS